MESLGVKLLEGRNFTEAEIELNPDPSGPQFSPFAIISKDTAIAVFGDEHAVGKTIYGGADQTAIVIGVMDNMLGAWVGWDKLTQVMLLPRIQAGPLAR